MNTVRIYIDENLDTSDLSGLKQMIQAIPHVHGVEVSHREPHEVMVEYDEQQNMPVKLIQVLREKGFHPDILSA